MRAAQDLGIPVRTVETDGSELLCVIRKDMTPDDPRRRALALADNQTAKLSFFDDDKLVSELQTLGDHKDLLEAVGLPENELLDLLTPPDDSDTADAEPQTDRAAELREQWGTAPGQLWLLGEGHRLLIGDCRKPEDVARLMGADKINVAFTSPPYASQRKYDESSGFKPIPPDEYVQWWEPVQANVRKHLAADGSFFVNIKPHCEDGERVLYVFDLVLKMRRGWGWRFVDELCWHSEGLPGAFPNRFRNSFEPVFHFCQQMKIKFHPLEVGHVSESIRDGTGGLEKTNGGNWTIDAPMKSGIAQPGNVLKIAASATAEHSAAFPVGLPSFFIRAFSDPGDIIVDPFMGSGTTCIAAENHGRQSRGIEISPEYCAVILQRYRDAFPDQEIRLGSA